jgi:nucleoside transporter
MDKTLYVQLSVLMFLEFAIWGAWSPVLAARLLGTLKMSGKQTGWIYGTFPLACIVFPIVGGQIADRWVNMEYILAAAQLLGAVLILIAARARKFGSLFLVMLLYSACYTTTLPLVNALMFAQLGKVFSSSADVNNASVKIFIWAPVAWAAVGWLLSGWRWKKGTGEGSDCMVLAGILSLIMGVFCLFLPHTPPSEKPGAVLAFAQAFSMLKDSNFLIFMIVSLVGAGTMQFYFLGTAHYLQDIGLQSRSVPAAMAVAQWVQAAATLFLLPVFLTHVGFHRMLTIGVGCWVILYFIFSLTRPVGLVVASQAMHGFAYVLFIIGGQIYVNAAAPSDIIGSAQGLVFMATTGVGLFLGTQLTGVVMDRFRADGKFRWRPIFLVPCVVTLLCAVGFYVFFKG